MSDIQTTRLGRNWLLKMGLFLMLLLGFGVWGLVDAVWVYKSRGLSDTSVRLRDYLGAAEAVGKLHPDEIKVPDERGTLAALAPRAEELRAKSGPGSADARQAAVESTRLELLGSLARAWEIGKGPVRIDHPRSSKVPLSAQYFDVTTGQAYAIAPDGARTEVPLGKLLGELRERWEKTKTPSPLSGYDMPVQWVFVVVGFGGGLWLIFVLLRAASTKYRWEAAAQRLTLPDGRAIVPSDIKEFDKRKWHRFFVTLNLHDGKGYACDLLRYQPLEEWVLEMERTAFPESAQTTAGSPASPGPDGVGSAPPPRAEDASANA